MRTMDATRRMAARGFGWAAVLAAAALAGCGDAGSADSEAAPPPEPVHPVKGKVVLGDGKPLAEGTVTFVPVKEPGRHATGTLRSDGSFSLATKDLGEGAPEGEYKVRIESAATTGGGKASRSAVPAKYQDEDSSGLKVTVKAGPNDLPPFQLK
jgi:hypothetical protein